MCRTRIAKWQWAVARGAFGASRGCDSASRSRHDDSILYFKLGMGDMGWEVNVRKTGGLKEGGKCERTLRAGRQEGGRMKQFEGRMEEDGARCKHPDAQ